MIPEGQQHVGALGEQDLKVAVFPPQQPQVMQGRGQSGLEHFIPFPGRGPDGPVQRRAVADQFGIAGIFRPQGVERLEDCLFLSGPAEDRAEGRKRRFAVLDVGGDHIQQLSALAVGILFQHGGNEERQGLFPLLGGGKLAGEGLFGSIVRADAGPGVQVQDQKRRKQKKDLFRHVPFP